MVTSTAPPLPAPCGTEAAAKLRSMVRGAGAALACSTIGSRTKPSASTATAAPPPPPIDRSEEHTSELQSLMRISYAVFCLKKKKNIDNTKQDTENLI